MKVFEALRTWIGNQAGTTWSSSRREKNSVLAFVERYRRSKCGILHVNQKIRNDTRKLSSHNFLTKRCFGWDVQEARGGALVCVGL